MTGPRILCLLLYAALAAQWWYFGLQDGLFHILLLFATPIWIGWLYAGYWNVRRGHGWRGFLRIHDRQWLSYDQRVNAAWDGNEDSTLSGRMGRQLEKRGEDAEVPWLLNTVISFVEGIADHCKRAIERDERRSRK